MNFILFIMVAAIFQALWTFILMLLILCFIDTPIIKSIRELLGKDDLIEKW